MNEEFSLRGFFLRLLERKRDDNLRKLNGDLGCTNLVDDFKHREASGLLVDRCTERQAGEVEFQSHSGLTLHEGFLRVLAVLVRPKPPRPEKFSEHFAAAQVFVMLNGKAMVGPWVRMQSVT